MSEFSIQIGSPYGRKGDPPPIQPFGDWLADQRGHEVPAIRHAAIRSQHRRPALLAMHERFGAWPTFVDYAAALDVVGDDSMLEAVSRAWNEWRNTGNATPRKGS